MKTIIFYFFIFEFINITCSVVPVWDLKKSGIDVFEKYKINYRIIDAVIHDNFRFYLETTLSKEGNHIIKTNTLVLGDENYKINSAPWDDIESAYTNKNDKFYFCPKGKISCLYLL